MPAKSFEDIINNTQLPTLPTVAMQILEITRDPNVKLTEIEKLVQSDPGLATRVLRTVNCSLYGLKKPCASIKRALAYLGLNAVKSLVLGFSFSDTTSQMETDDSFSFKTYWRRIIVSAAAARQISDLVRAGDPDEAFTCGIFQDIGLLAMLVGLEDEYIELLEATATDHERLEQMEQAQLGFSHSKVGAALSKRWQMPELITDFIKEHHQPAKAFGEVKDPVRLVALGRMAAAALDSERPVQAANRLRDQLNSWYQQKFTDVTSLLDKIGTTAKELAGVLDQDIGAMPDVQVLMAEAQQQQIALQVRAGQEMDTLREENTSLSTQTVTDGLTGAWNRKKFDDDLSAAFRAARTDETPLGALFVDADKFKSVNDTHGHQAGDAVLVTLAQRMKEATGDRGDLYRYGGEEFAILLPGSTTDDARQVGEDVRRAICDAPFDLSDVEGAPNTLPITVSVGVSAVDNGGPARLTSSDILLKEADEAVYTAKQTGRNRVCVYGAPSATEPAASEPTPVSPPAPVADAAPSSSAAEVINILLIEDDPLAATLFNAVLKKQPGVMVRIADTSQKGLAYLQHAARTGTAPQVVICDMQLDERSGIEITRWIRSTDGLSSVPVVIVTAQQDPSTLITAQSVGATAVFTKHQIASNMSKWVQAISALWQNQPAA